MDHRTAALADAEATVAAHQPGDDGTCPLCHVTYPCGPLLLAENAIEAAERRTTGRHG